MHTANTGTHGTRVVAYLRRSSKAATRQEASLEDQRAKVLALCDLRGWIVSEWFVESASASKDRHLRKELDRLLAAMQSPGRSWAGIVVWRWDRMSRTDSLDQSIAVAIRGAGVWLESTTEGRADWDTEIGRLTWAMKAEQSSGDVRKLSEATVGGRTSALKEGYWTAGKVPWGYDRRYVRAGCEDIIIARKATAGRPAGYRCKPVINEEERPLVEWLYRSAANGATLHSLARALNEKGIETAHGSRGGRGGWNAAGVSVVLRNPTYKGDLSASGNHKSRRGGRKVKGYFEGVVEAIVDPETWQQAVDGIGKRLRKKTNKFQSGVLSGMVTCGHCGTTLKKQPRKQRVCVSCGETVRRKTVDGTCLSCGGKVGDEFVPVTMYSCPANLQRPGKASCRQHVVYEEPLLDVIRDTLYPLIESEVLAKALFGPKEGPSVDLDELKRRMEAARRAVSTATKRALLLDEDVAEEASGIIRALKVDLKALEAQVALASTATGSERSAAGEWLKTLREDWVACHTPEFVSQMESTRKNLVGRLELAESVIGYDGRVLTRRQPVPGYGEALTGLFRRLGVVIAVHWEAKDGGKAGEFPSFVRIDAKFDVPVGFVKPGETTSNVSKLLPLPTGRNVCTVDLLAKP